MCEFIVFEKHFDFSKIKHVIKNKKNNIKLTTLKKCYFQKSNKKPKFFFKKNTQNNPKNKGLFDKLKFVFFQIPKKGKIKKTKRNECSVLFLLRNPNLENLFSHQQFKNKTIQTINNLNIKKLTKHFKQFKIKK